MCRIARSTLWKLSHSESEARNKVEQTKQTRSEKKQAVQKAGEKMTRKIGRNKVNKFASKKITNYFIFLEKIENLLPEKHKLSLKKIANKSFTKNLFMAKIGHWE